MFATLLFGSLALVGPVARAPLQESGSAAGTRVLVRVIDAATGAPVGAAEVIALDHARALADWSARNVSPDLAEWEATRERLGTRARTDASGSASFERGRGALCFSASAPGRWGEVTLEAGATDTIELRIEPDVTLEIAVVDELGTPAGGTAVALVSSFGRESGESAPAAFEHFLATASSDVRDGLARFRHVQTLLRPQEHTRCFARLAIPLASDVELELDPTDLGGGRRTLTVPPTGRVAFDCADVPTGYVRIRRAVPGEPTRSAWFSTDPLRAEIVAGKALFERVGVGVTIEYEARSPRQGPPIRGSAAGPASAGALVEIATPRDSAFPVLVGRVIDEDGRPVGDATLRVGLTRHFRGEQGTGAESRGSTLVTDAAGRFQFPLRDAAAQSDDRRTFDVGDGERGSAEIELPPGLSTGTLELGDVRIAAPGSTRWLESKDDSTLEAEYRRALAACELNGAHALEVETCLTEVARRGGEHWVAFLKSELERVRAAPEFGDVPEDLEVLTALRRAERKPDPLALELDGEPLFVCVFPSAPTIVCRLTNVDVGGESFGLTVGGSYRSGRFARCRAAVLDAAGNELEPLPPPGFMGGGLCSRSPLAPARSLEFSVPLGQYVAWPHAGDYRVKLLYHDETDIA
ncbi:MAG: hypothetical protein IT453_15485, partial [Planctomycetes bacterium]|nr:hypothetical protein [Planctomycetota bacterium]